MMGLRALISGISVVLAGLAWTTQNAIAQELSEESGQVVERHFKLPPTTPLSPQDEIKTIRTMPGYRLECIAAEPLVHDPVAMSIDPDGRLWVCEMRGFMSDIDRKREMEPVGTISVLEDTDGDGVMDKSTVFVNKLVLPRAVCWTSDGVLVAENGHIWLCRDSTGGLHCDQKTLLFEYNPGNLEHALNGLVPMLDNWIYCAKEGFRLRKVDGKWVRESTAARGQWGITQDDQGYLVYNVNAQLIRGDLVPCYSLNALFSNPLVNVRLFTNQEVWPIRPNPGINRGYLSSFLRPDGTMIHANADCGPVVYRGDNLPAELKGNVFIPEPAANLVRRQVVVEENGLKSSHNAYDRAEFLASTDERFRPVNMYNAPDGTLYLIDMYRGIIQHGQFMTPYLRKDALERGLEKPIGLGRIFRIVHETTQPRKPPQMSKMSSAELVAHLSSANGWDRDMAQQLLVQRNDLSAVPELQKLARDGASPLGRLHALWTLEGLGKVDARLVGACLKDKDANVRASAVALSRGLLLRAPDSPLVDKLAALRNDPDPNVRMQVFFALGLLPGEVADSGLEPILKQASADPVLLQSLLAGFSGREADFLAQRLSLPAWNKAEPWREQLLKLTAGLLWRQRQPISVLRLLDLAAKQAQSWQQMAILEGLTSPSAAPTRRPSVLGPRPLTLPTVPQSLEKLRKSADAAVAAAARKAAAQLNWPGKDGKPLPIPPPLTPHQQALYDTGQKVFLTICAACHSPGGFGEAGKGPSLLESEWLDKDERVIRLVLVGLRGPVAINGEAFNRDGALEMPAMGLALDDEQIAGVITYVRRQWRPGTPPIEPDAVAHIRALMRARATQWTARELLDATPDPEPRDIAFRRHVINADSEFMAAAVFDVNKDGKLDIVCGGWWYEAPTWKKHFLRNVEIIGGRPDGYAHQVLDVNGDGWPDIITVNWRSKTVKWIEHPGAALSREPEWKAHTIATPGNMETGRLCDIMGDGTPCILPSTVPFWWELARKPDGPQWIQHELPRQIAGHGVGFGDINGDGRGDIVGHDGWLEAPVDRRNGKWIWHPDFELGQTSIPILVVDVDGDGLNDLVWSMGHDYGVYWLRQSREKEGKITWTRNAIDTSWAGSHAPLWVDLDGDGKPELVVGRRYRAHEGADPGEFDPQAIYRYVYQPLTRTWHRQVISYNDNTCFGLDPVAVDLTGSGRMDLVFGGRHGLYWLENLGVGDSIKQHETHDPLWFPTYADPANVMVIKDESGRERPVKDAFDIGQRRAQTLAALQGSIGVLPDSSQRPPLDIKVLTETKADNYIRQKITFAVDLKSRMSAELFIPAKLTRGTAAVICLANAKDEPAQLVAKGFICLVPENSPAGDSMKAIWQNIRCLDVLESLPQVSRQRLGIIGHGPQASIALLTAAFDCRIWATVADRLPTQKESKATLAEIVAALAPRPVFIVATPPDLEPITNVRTGAAAVYQFRRVGNSLQAQSAEPGNFTDWLVQQLRPRTIFRPNQ